jgi:hypothetical protein
VTCKNVTLRLLGFDLCQIAWEIEGPGAGWSDPFACARFVRPANHPDCRIDNAIIHFVQQQQGASTHMPANLWQPGQSGNAAGRPRGSRNRAILNEEFIGALLRHFRREGERAIARMAATQPAAYCKLLTLLVPREHKLELSNPIKALTDEQLETMIEYIETLLEAQAQSARVVEGQAEVVRSLPAPAPRKPAS